MRNLSHQVGGVSRRLLSIALLFAVACGGGSGFSPTFPDNRRADLESVSARLASSSAPNAPAVAAMLTTEPKLVLVGLDDGAVRWSQPVDSPVSAPHVAGDYVVLHERGGVVVRDLSSGATRATIEDESMFLTGAGGEGRLIALALSTGGGVGARSKLVVIDGGSVAYARELEQALGAPTVAAGMVFVPWATQNVSVLDDGGAELARVRLTDTPVGRVFRSGSDVFLGQRAVMRFSPELASGTREAAGGYEPTLRPVPGDPAFVVDPYRPTPSPSSAVHRLRYAWGATQSGARTALVDGNLYAIFYRFVFALESDGPGVRWVHEHDADLVGADVVDGGVVLVDANGGLAMLDAASGATRWARTSGTSPVVASVRASGVATGAAGVAATEPLANQLLTAAQSTDARLVPAQVLAVQMLAGLEGAEVTRNLIVLCESARAPASVRDGACNAVASRSDGADEVLSALARHARFLEGTTAPPVGPLARAAVTMRETRAVPHLLAHLRDPATAEAHLAPLARALTELEARESVEPLRDFLRLYHAEAESPEMIAGLAAVTDAIVALQGAAAQELLQELADDALTVEGLRPKLAEHLAALTAEEPSAADDEGEEGGEAGEGEGATETETPTEARLPASTTVPVLEATLEPVMTSMRACLTAANARSARLVLDLEGDGTLRSVVTAPEELGACLEPLVRSVTFRGNSRNAREQVRYTLRR
ncbi:MAG: PQQ-like beta-propeller repeat protein [Myxococcota bacterium]|jgi:hypothetical protein|nr:PQQ-like beta-propeller repeat protein [Myxococcota bacterium]